MSAPSLAEPLLQITDPKVAAAALAAGGRLASVESAPTGRLVFFVSGLPADFMVRITNDEIQVSARRFISAMEMLLGLIAERQRGRR
jgi:hypothetical protein